MTFCGAAGASLSAKAALADFEEGFRRPLG
jgi:hypothetical protein